MSKIFQAAITIINHWKPQFTDEKVVARLMAAKSKQVVRLAHDNSIEGTNGDHHQTITIDGWMDCDCPSFIASRRKPCKHLFAIAHGIVRDW